VPSIFTALACAIIIDKAEKLATHARILKYGRSGLALEIRMQTQVTEIADGIFRLSTFVPDIAPPAGFVFNQFLVRGDEPLLFHTGLRKMFASTHQAVSRIMPPQQLRWISFGHFEADECGALNEWLAAAPQAQAAHGQTGCMVSLQDVADRAPRQLGDGEVLDLGRGKRVRYIDTPHTPHGWDAGLLYEETTRTLLCGDLFTQLGNDAALTQRDIVGPAIAAEDLFQFSCLNPNMGTTIRGLAELAPRTLALMHGPSFRAIAPLPCGTWAMTMIAASQGAASPEPASSRIDLSTEPIGRKDARIIASPPAARNRSGTTASSG
jgi:flavorubredoxin